MVSFIAYRRSWNASVLLCEYRKNILNIEKSSNQCKKMIFDDNIIQIIFKKKLYASNPRSQGPFYFELSWSGERTLGTRLYASKNGHRWLAKYLNLDRLQEKLLQTWWKMTSKQRKISLFSSTWSWGCCLATQRSSQRCLGYALDLFWTVTLAARSIEVSCKAFATLLIS